MQRPKEEIRQRIIDTARDEFFEHGFKDTSMRAIARKAGVGLGNIYNYFRNKDEILSVVLKPLLEDLDKLLDEHNLPERISLSVYHSDSFQHVQMKTLVRLVTQYRQELKLLFLRAHGSKLEPFRDEYTEKGTAVGIEYLRQMKEKYPQINNRISKFFIHNSTSWWISTITEIVSHDLSREEIEQFVSEYVVFATEGWLKLIEA